MSHFVFGSGYYLAINRGIIRLESGILANYTSQKFLTDELSKAHLGPIILISYVVGPEMRDGRSLHYDALLCLQYASEEPGHPNFDRRNTALQLQAFSSVVESIYGDEYPGGPKAKEHCKTIEFKSNYHRETVYLYVNAYKNRLKHSFKQVLLAHELLMPHPGNMRLKGFGLGAFGISELEIYLETIFVQVLDDVLHISRPTKINRIELLNFQSMMGRFSKESGDLDYFLQHGGGITACPSSCRSEVWGGGGCVPAGPCS